MFRVNLGVQHQGPRLDDHSVTCRSGPGNQLVVVTASEQRGEDVAHKTDSKRVRVTTAMTLSAVRLPEKTPALVMVVI